MAFTAKQIAKMIDHALLKPELDNNAVTAGCELAAKYEVASVCVRPVDVAAASNILKGTEVEVGTVIGFPHGAFSPAVKVFESKQAMDDGATELDIVCSIGKVISGEYNFVKDELAKVVEVAHERNVMVKVIFENCYLTDDQKRKMCEISLAAKADYVKTSTGFGTSGATLEDIALMVNAVDGMAKVKAAGGISDADTALAFAQAGCTRLGASATADIVDELLRREGAK